jgi:hypothetical protein
MLLCSLLASSILAAPSARAQEPNRLPAAPTDSAAAGDAPAVAPPVTLDRAVSPPIQPPPGSPPTPVEPGPIGPPPGSVQATVAPPSVPEWTRTLSVGGGAILWYYQPLQSGAKNNIDLYFVNLLLDGHVGDVGLHIEPRFRDNKLRAHFGGTNGGTAWVQEVYASFRLPGATLKVGKAYSHFGLFWDNSFYGNVQVYDGLKLDPDYGLSLEAATGDEASLGLRAWAQYFVVDGQTNVALDGRETFTIPGARRRNHAILRLEPFFRAAGALTLKVGLSAAYLQADLPALGKKDVYRGAGDLTVSVGPWTLWGEFIRQNGQTVTDFPIAGTPATAGAPATPGIASSHINYLLVGSELTLGRVALRYNVSYGGYRDVDVSEWLHVPGIGFSLAPNVTVLGEFVYWKRYAPTADVLVDKSIDVTLLAHF